MRAPLALLVLCCCGGTKTATTNTAPQPSVTGSTGPVVVAQDLDGGIPKIDPEAVKKVIHEAQRRFALCYVDGLKKKKDLAGRVETKFVIDETGHVISAEDVTRSNVLQDDDARSCIVAKFKQLEFPPPQPSGKVPITYPMLFDPSMIAMASAPDAGAAVPEDLGSDYGHGRKPFDMTAALTALKAIDAKACGFHGSGHVKVTFDPSGVATKEEVDAPATISKVLATCISHAYGAARVPVFGGSAITVGKAFNLP